LNALAHFTRKPARMAAVLAACMALAPALAQLPTLGDSSELAVGAERKLGERIARELYRDPDYIDDALLSDYIQGIWQRLLAAARTRGELTAELDERFAWEVLLGKDKSINAFALPGGWLGLHLGLLGVTTSQDELASVLAHELSHVTQRHISRMLTEENRRGPLLVAAMVLGVLAASKNPEAGNAVIASSQAVAAQGQLNFSRDMEREADRVGFGVATQAGFEPQGFVTMFEKLQQAARLNDNGNYPYLRTHPMNTERIAEMQARQPMGRTAPAAGPTFEHGMMTARAKVFSYPGVDGLRGLVSEAQSVDPAKATPVRQAAVYYAAALASSRLREPSAAASWQARLAAVTRGDAGAARLARLLEAEVAMSQGNAARAAQLADLSAADRPEMLLGAQARVRAGQAADVAGRLQTWVALHPRDAAAWQLLASAYAAQGQTLRSIRAEAEAQVAHLDYAAAMDRFKAAQELVRRSGAGGDHIEASIIDTRARQVQSMLREQALER
jgi:predicted Zn-dependent protease